MKKIYCSLCLALCIFNGVKAQFKLYNWVRYNNTPSLTPYLQPQFLSMQGLTNSDNSPNFAAVKTFASSTLANTAYPVTLDIETWAYGKDSLTNTINRYNAVMDTFRSVNTTSKIGFYGVPPEQRYSWGNLNTAYRYNAWMVINDSLERMASNVDIFFPSAYSRDSSTSNWQNYIDSNVSVIRNLYDATKPIYFYISPQYIGTSAGAANAQFIDAVRWKFLLNLIYNSQANGAVIWTSNKDSLGNYISFNSNMPWWTVTKEFMVQKGLAPTFVMDSLNATYSSAGQLIHWTTSTDTTTAYFVVQRSTDSFSFNPVSGNISSLNSFYTENRYNYTDSTSALGTTYYRIQMVANDGSISYSNVLPYSPPVHYQSAGTGVTVDLATATNWQTYNGTAWVAASTSPNSTVTNGSVVIVQSADIWQNNIAATSIPIGVTLIDSGVNGTFSTTNKFTASGTIVYSGKIAQSIPAITALTSSTLNNLTINNPAGVSTTSGSWTLTGALTLTSGQFNCNNGGGSFFCNGAIVVGSGKLNASGFFELLGTTAQSIPANILVGNSIAHLITGGHGLTSNGPITIPNSIALGTGNFTLGGNLYITGTAISTSGGGIQGGSDTIILGSSGTQIIPAGFFVGNTVNYLNVKGVLSDTARTSTFIVNALGVATLKTVVPLVVSGTATIGGAVNIAAFVTAPYVGQTFTILSATSVSGTFSGGVTLPPGYTGSLSYTSTSVVLTINGIGSRPMQLVNFGGIVQADANQLQWETANEFNTQNFEVQIATDGINYNTIGLVVAKGSVGNTYVYSNIINDPLSFYRLKINNIDGKYTYSGVIKLGNPFNMGKVSTVYPNPVKNTCSLHIGNLNLMGTSVQILDMLGRQLQSFIININSQNIDLSNYGSGVYYVQLKDGEVLKILKQ